MISQNTLPAWAKILLGASGDEDIAPNQPDTGEGVNGQKAGSTPSEDGAPKQSLVVFDLQSPERKRSWLGALPTTAGDCTS